MLLSILLATTLAADTTLFFQPAVMVDNPYEVEGFYNPPWLLPILYPLRFLSAKGASLAMRIVAIVCAIYVSWRLTKNPIAVLAYTLSAPIILDVLSGNINALLITGIFLPPPLALIVLSIKPHLTIGVMFYLVWKHGLKITIPLVLIILISFAMYGWWPAAMSHVISETESWNHSIWPWGIGLGLGFLLFSNDRLTSLAASPFFSPYVSGAGWAGLLLWLSVKMPFIVLAIDIILLGVGIRMLYA